MAARRQRLRLPEPEEPEGSVQRPGAVPSHGHRTLAATSVLFRQFTKAENEKLATTWGPFGSLSRDGQWLLLGYWVDTEVERSLAGELRRVPAHRQGDSARRVGGHDGLASGTVIGDTLYLQTTKGAPKGRVVAAPVATPDESHWRDIVPERADAVIESVSFAKGLIVGHLPEERLERRRSLRPDRQVSSA